MALVVPNFARTTLRAPITPSSTVLQLATGGSAYFYIGTGNYMYVTIEDGNSVEIVKYTDIGYIVNDEITVVRAQDGTTAKAFPAGACVKVAWNVAQVEELVEQTFISLFSTVTLPPNTIEVVNVPTSPPPINVIYAIWVAQKRLWYWNGSVWTEIGGAGTVLAGNGDPSGTPLSSVAFYVDLLSGALWYWTGSAWIQVAAPPVDTTEYWTFNNIGSGSDYYILGVDPDTQVALGGTIPYWTRFRKLPLRTPTILERQMIGGAMRTVLLEAAAIDVSIALKGRFGSPGASPPSTTADVAAGIQLVLTNSYNQEYYGNIATVAENYQPSIVLAAATGAQTWPAGTYFDGNLVYTVNVGATPPFPIFYITQAVICFHVIEAGAVPPPYVGPVSRLHHPPFEIGPAEYP